ncbi:MAG: AAA family ATPase [Bacteroidetes bacterium]|nr:AAA family ATPase [Bacteroidota bacterium]
MVKDTKQHYLWVEKYRPTTLDNYIGNDHLKQKFEGYISEQEIPQLLFTGPAGTGKTTAAKILLNSIDCDYVIINASDENNIDTVRNKIRGFASTTSFKPLKIMLLDEFDGFTHAGQGALRNVMEQFSRSTRFILTANYVEKIIDPIISRTQHFKVVPPSRKDVAIHLANILKGENVSYSVQDIKFLVDSFFPDIRKVLGEAQAASRNGALEIDRQHIVENDYKMKVVEILIGSGTKSEKFKEVRQLFADNSVRDFIDMYRLLYDRITEITPNNVSLGILAVAEGQYKDALVVDKEINAMATIINVLEYV